MKQNAWIIALITVYAIQVFAFMFSDSMFEMVKRGIILMILTLFLIGEKQ